VIGWFGSCRRTWGPLLAQRRAGAIPESDSRRLDRHLARCAPCRALAGDLDALKATLVEAAGRTPLDHPEPEQLAALEKAGMPAAERERLERHLESCATCRSEWNVARSWSPPRLASRWAPVAPRPWSWFGAGLATATVTASLVAVLLWPDGAERRLEAHGLRATAEPVQVRGLHHRASDEPTAVPLPSSGDLLVSLTVEAAPGSALSVELLRRDGSVVSAGSSEISGPSGLVFVTVPSASVPPEGGEFRVTVEATGEAFHYPFRIAAGGR
jgi:hypothetical protein